MLELFVFSETVYQQGWRRNASHVSGMARHTGIILRDESGQLYRYQVTNRSATRVPLTWELVKIDGYRCETKSECGNWLQRVGTTDLTIDQAAQIFEAWSDKPENKYYHFGGREHSGWLRGLLPLPRTPSPGFIPKLPPQEPSANCRNGTNDNINTLLEKGNGCLDSSLSGDAVRDKGISSVIEQKARRGEFNTDHIESKQGSFLRAYVRAKKAQIQAELLRAKSTQKKTLTTSGDEPQAASGGPGSGNPRAYNTAGNGDDTPKDMHVVIREFFEKENSTQAQKFIDGVAIASHWTDDEREAIQGIRAFAYGDYRTAQNLLSHSARDLHASDRLRRLHYDASLNVSQDNLDLLNATQNILGILPWDRLGSSGGKYAHSTSRIVLLSIIYRETCHLSACAKALNKNITPISLDVPWFSAPSVGLSILENVARLGELYFDVRTPYASLTFNFMGTLTTVYEICHHGSFLSLIPTGLQYSLYALNYMGPRSQSRPYARAVEGFLDTMRVPFVGHSVIRALPAAVSALPLVIRARMPAWELFSKNSSLQIFLNSKTFWVLASLPAVVNATCAWKEGRVEVAYLAKAALLIKERRLTEAARMLDRPESYSRLQFVLERMWLGWYTHYNPLLLLSSYTDQYMRFEHAKHAFPKDSSCYTRLQRELSSYWIEHTEGLVKKLPSSVCSVTDLTKPKSKSEIKAEQELHDGNFINVAVTEKFVATESLEETLLFLQKQLRLLKECENVVFKSGSNDTALGIPVEAYKERCRQSVKVLCDYWKPLLKSLYQQKLLAQLASPERAEAYQNNPRLAFSELFEGSMQLGIIYDIFGEAYLKSLLDSLLLPMATLSLSQEEVPDFVAIHESVIQEAAVAFYSSDDGRELEAPLIIDDTIDVERDRGRHEAMQNDSNTTFYEESVVYAFWSVLTNWFGSVTTVISPGGS